VRARHRTGFVVHRCRDFALAGCDPRMSMGCSGQRRQF
jgi:hypothetical protein